MKHDNIGEGMPGNSLNSSLIVIIIYILIYHSIMDIKQLQKAFNLQMSHLTQKS